MKIQKSFVKEMLKLLAGYAIFTGAIAAIFFFFFLSQSKDFRQKLTPAPTPTPSIIISTNPTPSPTPDEENIFCTQDVKLCPDGSYVSRTGPKCDFAPCPEPN